MHCLITRHGASVRVMVGAQLTVANRHELKRAVLDELDAGARSFAVDLAATSYVDSAGLGALVSISHSIRERRGELRLVRLGDELCALLELTALDKLFTIERERRRGPRELDPRRGAGARFAPQPRLPTDGRAEA